MTNEQLHVLLESILDELEVARRNTEEDLKQFGLSFNRVLDSNGEYTNGEHLVAFKYIDHTLKRIRDRSHLLAWVRNS